MSDLEQNRQNEFMIEKIKERPVNKRKLLRRTLITASMAVIFGLIACFTFLVLEPVISNWLYPEEEPEIVVFPEDVQEMSPEEMLSDNMQTENQELQESPADISEEELRSLLAEMVLNKDHCRQIYQSMSEYVRELNRYMVTITGVTSNIDWFNNVQESENHASGVIIADNGRELLILADGSPIEGAQELTLSFSNGVQAAAYVKQKDAFTNLAVLAVKLSDLPVEGREEMTEPVKLGSSNLINLTGTPVAAVGSPMGVSGSIGYGVITAPSRQVYAADRTYRILYTDISCSQNPGGVLFDLQGQVIGIIKGSETGNDMKNMLTAYGITELKKVIEKMSNGEKAAYAGICGTNVTKEANEELNVPYGAYVKEVEMDSPAMLAGIQQGDVIVEMDGKSIDSFAEYTDYLLQTEAGHSLELKVMRLGQEEYKEMEFDIVLSET